LNESTSAHKIILLEESRTDPSQPGSGARIRKANKSNKNKNKGKELPPVFTEQQSSIILKKQNIELASTVAKLGHITDEPLSKQVLRVKEKKAN
jgi:hypothetical protein